MLNGFQYRTGPYFTRQTNLMAAGLCGLVYQPAANWTTEAQLACGIADITSYPTGYDFVPAFWIVHEAEGYTVVIAGTTTSTQWLSYLVNAGVVPAYAGAGNVFAPYNLIAQAIVPVLQQRITPQYRIFFTGHSAGGAIANLVAMKMQALNYRVAGCWTYGAPKVGDAAFAASYNVPGMRIVNESDPVPIMPPDFTSTLSAVIPGLPAIPQMFNVGHPVFTHFDRSYFDPETLYAMWTSLQQNGWSSFALPHYIQSYASMILAQSDQRTLNNLGSFIQVLQAQHIFG
jgi:hypothetical protein